MYIFFVGIKRKRWTCQEEEDFNTAFDANIKKRINLTTTEIREAKKNFKSLCERSEAVIRTRMNNIILKKNKN